MDLVTLKHNGVGKLARPSRRGTVAWLCVAGWSMFVVLALWWLLRGDSGPAVYLFRDGDSTQRVASEHFRAWFKGDLGLQRAYPWILFAPYVALIAFYFPLERARLRLNWALNLGACIGFVWASHGISERTSIRGATVVVLRTQGQIKRPADSHRTNLFQIGGIAGAGEEGIISDSPEAMAAFKSARKAGNLPDDDFSNLLTQFGPDMKPALPPPGLPRLGLWSMLLDLLAYCAVVGLAHSVYFYRRFREREHQALLLEANLTQARLNALRAQLEPHFLFNSLNAIAALLRRDARLAEATLLSLSELLRLALSQSQRQEISLREEMNLVRHYLEIQQTRFGDKLRVEQEVEPAALDCLVPTLLLQPVVENAIRHGIEPADHRGLVRVCARRCGNRLVLIVDDDGIGLANGTLPAAAISEGSQTAQGLQAGLESHLGCTGPPRGNGIGLSNLRARLETLYGTEQRLNLAPRKEGGVTVRIEIPWVPGRCR